ncbi:MAG: hypothetical protein EBV27_08280, partial [Actinobacteria bacterium]|nr:hypothetical protein [Actinomycetota bacterium]
MLSKKRLTSVVLASVLISGFGASASLADTTSAEAKAAYRTAITAYKAEIATYKSSRESIKATFASAKAAAVSTKNAALASATTDEQ